MNLTTFYSTLELGLIFSVLACGLFLSFRILDVPDLTVDGSFVTGAAICSMLVKNNQPWLALVVALFAGMLCGLVSGLLQTKIKIQPILAGILTMTALYSINLKITAGSPSVFLFGMNLIYARFSPMIVHACIVIVSIAALTLFLKTPLGLALRATGDNEAMVRSSSINTDRMKIMGLMLANGFVALSGALFTQYQASFDHASGTGMLVLGLASIIIGETLIPHRSVFTQLCAVSVGAVIYRFTIAFAFLLGLPASDLKLFSALIVILSILLPKLSEKLQKRGKSHA